MADLNDFQTHMRLPSLAPGWLGSGPELFAIVFALCITLVCLVYLGVILALYLADRISYRSYERQAEHLAYVMAFAWLVILYMALGPAKTIIFAAPLVLGVLYCRWLGSKGKDELQAAELDRYRAAYDEDYYLGSKSQSAPGFLEKIAPRNMHSLHERLAHFALPLALAAYMAWTLTCDRWGWTVLFSAWTVYWAVLTYKDDFIGPKGKWRSAVEPYIGFCLEQEKQRLEVEKDDEEETGRKPPENKGRWVLHGLVHYGTILGLQYLTRSYCRSRL